MIKLPTVKVNGQTAFVINRHQVEDDVAVAEAICADAERYRFLRDLFHKEEAFDKYPGYRWFLGFYDDDKHVSVDAAIDAARKAK